MNRILVVVFFAASLAVAQDTVHHAPTVVQCQGDAHLWLSRLEDIDAVHRPKYAVLVAWEDEMMNCIKIDPRNDKLYSNELGESLASEVTLLSTFLQRNNLWDRFSGNGSLAEDLANYKEHWTFCQEHMAELKKESKTND